ncbi:MAG: 16S rRNA (guanine(527)-N(7))-methyltransferase RsmG [Ruminococcus sp.]|nr:16S rRNA (guanine(527)-N(7))-methyltransferase RsmG [Ruminococcus sp.]
MLINQIDLEKLFSQGGMTVTKEQYDKLFNYSKLLVEWNEKINLTAITDPEGIALKHFYDSVYPFTLTEISLNSSVIDVGTGAGFPSCPLKIFRKDLNITLLDSLNKRVKFLQEISDKLDLNANCIHGRAEELGQNTEHREQYDIACARAVSNLSELCEYCLPFVKVGGKFVSLKGSNGKEELKNAQNAIKVLGGEVVLVNEYTLPNGDGRTLIVIKKISPTPEKYPRNKGQMKKKPL